MKKITKISVFALLLLCGFQGANAQAPTTAAPTPTQAASNVKSFYSDVYSPLNGTSVFSMAWGQASVMTFVKLFGSDNLIKMTTMDWDILGLTAPCNVSDMDYLHLDAYLSTANSFLQVGLYTYQNPSLSLPEISVFSSYKAINSAGKWVSIDIPLKEFKDGGQPCTEVDCIRFNGASTVYVDNIYTYKIATGISNIKNDNSLKIYPTVVVSDLHLESIENIKEINIFNTTGQSVGTYGINALKSTINLSSLNSGSYIVSTRLTSGKVLSNRIIKL
jgi:hypothetical protein